MENTIWQRILYYSMMFVVLIGWVVSPLVTGPVAAGLQATLQCGGYSAQWQSARHGVDSASQQWPGQLGQLGRQSVRPKMDKHLTSRSIFEDLLVFFSSSCLILEYWIECTSVTLAQESCCSTVIVTADATARLIMWMWTSMGSSSTIWWSEVPFPWSTPYTTIGPVGSPRERSLRRARKMMW